MRTHGIRYFHLAIILLVLGTGLMVCADEVSTSPGTEEILLTAVFSQKPELAFGDISGETALSLAIEDINSYLKEIESPYHVSLTVIHYSGEPDSLLTALKSIPENGLPLVIGYFSSSQLEEIQDYVNAHDLLILSTGSSAPGLAIPDDMILRFNPDDTKQAMALHALFSHEKISHLLPLARDDLWGRELVSVISSDEEGAVTSYEPVLYLPNETDYSAVLDELDKNAGLVLEEQSPESTAILAVTFGEIVQIMESASDSTYPNLSKVRWIGTDGNTHIPDLINSAAATKFAYERRFTGATPSAQQENIVIPVRNRLAEKLGFEPDASALALYDVGWIATLSSLTKGAETGKSQYHAIMTIAQVYNGISGELALNENGDRIEAHYGYWQVKTDGTEGTWDLIGVYSWYAPEVPVDLIFFEEES